MSQDSRPALRLITDADSVRQGEWAWFCGHCAAPSPSGAAPAPSARVCPRCGLGLLLEAPREAVPSGCEAFLVIDSALLVQGVSRQAEKLLRVREDAVIDRPLHDLLVSADTQSAARTGLASAIVEATAGDDRPQQVHVRPANTYGVRLRARVAPCGPPRAAVLVLDEPPSESSPLIVSDR